ncbi:hypothetical protein POPTR_004G202466v4, partial [Populus trichocarpa]
EKRDTLTSIPFSAFWLRSSVVSVLISLISDTWANGSHDIKLIFLGGGSVTIACYWGSRASPARCTKALAWRTPPILVELISHSLIVIYIYIHCQELNLLEFSLNSFNKDMRWS